MQRYFVDLIKQNKIFFTEEQTHHIVNVMRMKTGDNITAVYKKQVFLCEIKSLLPLDVEIVKELKEQHELKANVTLLYALPKGEKLELVIQKATELGVKEIILVNSERCIAKINKESLDKKLIRFNKIALEASEQSKRNEVPQINRLINFNDIDKLEFDHKFIAYENEEEVTFKQELEKVKDGESIGILIGSEGGFSLKEVEYAVSKGYHSISLGKRILRSETAAIYALSVISFILEN